MSGASGFAPIFLVASIVAWLGGALAAAILVTRLGQALSPTERLRRCLLVTLLPWFLPALTAFAIVLLALAKPLGLIVDHCLEHGDGHPHICFEHLPHVSLNGLVAGIAAVVLAYIAASVYRFVVNESRSSDILRSMLSLARGKGPLRILDDDRALAFTSAVQGPTVLMTTGMLRSLSRSQRRIVLAHEAEHLRNGDLYWHRVLECLLLLHLPRTARRLRSVWLQSVEERVDDAVASRFGAGRVAEVLLATARGPKSPAPLSVAGGNTLARIRRLLASPSSRPEYGTFTCVYVMSLAVLPAAVLFAHHGLETLIGLLLSA